MVRRWEQWRQLGRRRQSGISRKRENQFCEQRDSEINFTLYCQLDFLYSTERLAIQKKYRKTDTRKQMAKDTFDRTTKRKIFDRKYHNSYVEHSNIINNTVLL